MEMNEFPNSLFEIMEDYDNPDLPDGAWQAVLEDVVKLYNRTEGTNYDSFEAFLAYLEWDPEKEHIPVGIFLTHPNAKMPVKATENAAAWDVYAWKIDHYDDLVIAYLGFKLDMPEDYMAVLVPRSSITKTAWVMQNSPGIGDPDFTGEYQMRFRKLYEVEPTVFPYQEGERVGQIFFQKIENIKLQEITEWSKDTDRGGEGFGSTGKS